MTLLILATLGFVFIHRGLSATGLRAKALGLLGAVPYQAVYSVLSLLLIIGMARGYGGAVSGPANVSLWAGVPGLNWLALILMVPAVFLVVVGTLTPGPTTAGMEGLLKKAPEPRGIHRLTRHPFLWGVSLFALAHLLVAGHLAGLILFGALLYTSLSGTGSIDRKRKVAAGDLWEAYAAKTSNVPLAKGGLVPAVREMGALRLAAGGLGFVAIAWAHAAVFGRAVLPG